MGRTRDADRRRGGGGGALTSFPSPSSSSSSDFEFTVSHSPTSRRSAPADELFYKGQLLPLHLSPRISMVRTLLLASSSTSSSSDATASRDSNSSSSSSSSSFASELLLLAPAPAADCDSSRPSSATDDDGRPHRRPNYFSSFASRFSSVFLHRNKKDLIHDPPPPPPKKPSVFKKYVNKVKPLYEKLSLLQQKPAAAPDAPPPLLPKKHLSFSIRKKDEGRFRGGEGGGRMGIYSHSHSFSGNLRYPRRKKCAGSCPSSMRSSPSHSGLLYGGGATDAQAALSTAASSSSSMEELQSAIQGAIAHCKSTMITNHKK